MDLFEEIRKRTWNCNAYKTSLQTENMRIIQTNCLAFERLASQIPVGAQVTVTVPTLKIYIKAVDGLVLEGTDSRFTPKEAIGENPWYATNEVLKAQNI